jgi:hypothetical protein
MIDPNSRLPTDPAVKIPPGVLAAAARAEEVQRQVYPTDSPTPTPEAPAPEVPAQERSQAKAPEVPAQEPVQAPTPEPTSPTNERGESWERKFHGLRGRYEKEVPELRAQVQELADQLSRANRRAQELEASAPPVTPTGNAPSSFEDLTPEEIEDYGEPFLKVVAKQAAKVATEMTASYQKEIGDLKRQLTGVTQNVTLSAQERMHQDLTKQVSNWQELNNDPNFIGWCQKIDPYSGQLRLDLLQSAYSKNDGPRVAKFFEGFLREQAAVAPQGASTQAPQAQDEPGVSLEDLAAPGRAKSAAASATGPGPADTKRVFSRAEIAKFFAERLAGKYRGREADADRIERDIFTAQNEGRVR